MAQNIANLIGKCRTRSSASSSDEQRSSPDYKKPKNLSVSSNSDSEHEVSTDAIMTALDLTKGEKLQLILAKLQKLDNIKISIKNIKSSLAAFELRTKRLEDFEVTATEGLEKLQKRCSDAEKRCKDKLEAFEGKLAKHKSMIAKLESKEQEINSKMEELKTKDLYLEAYSRRENIKFINIREPDSVTTTQEDTKEILRNSLEDELRYRDASTVEIQRVHRLGKKKNDDEPRPILARFLRYKDCEDILSLGHRLQGSNFQMFRDLPYEIVKRRKDQMATLKKAKQLKIPASFSRAQPDKLYVRGKLWPIGKALDTSDDTYE